MRFCVVKGLTIIEKKKHQLCILVPLYHNNLYIFATIIVFYIIYNYYLICHRIDLEHTFTYINFINNH